MTGVSGHQSHLMSKIAEEFERLRRWYLAFVVLVTGGLTLGTVLLARNLDSWIIGGLGVACILLVLIEASRQLDNSLKSKIMPVLAEASGFARYSRLGRSVGILTINGSLTPGSLDRTRDKLIGSIEGRTLESWVANFVVDPGEDAETKHWGSYDKTGLVIQIATNDERWLLIRPAVSFSSFAYRYRRPVKEEGSSKNTVEIGKAQFDVWQKESEWSLRGLVDVIEETERILPFPSKFRGAFQSQGRLFVFVYLGAEPYHLGGLLSSPFVVKDRIKKTLEYIKLTTALAALWNDAASIETQGLAKNSDDDPARPEVSDAARSAE